MSPRKSVASTAAPMVEDFEFLIDSGESLQSALARLGCSYRTIARRYQELGRPCPPGLWSLGKAS